MVHFVNNVRSFMNYAIFCELCDRMRFEVDCAKSHHRVISEGLNRVRAGGECVTLFERHPSPPPKKKKKKKKMKKSPS